MCTNVLPDADFVSPLTHAYKECVTHLMESRFGLDGEMLRRLVRIADATCQAWRAFDSGDMKWKAGAFQELVETYYNPDNSLDDGPRWLKWRVQKCVFTITTNLGSDLARAIHAGSIGHAGDII